MKILRFDDNRVGVLAGETVIDVTSLVPHAAHRSPQDVMEDLLGGLDRYRPAIDRLAAAGDGRRLGSVRLLAPLPRPSRVLAAFVNYIDRPERSAASLPIEFFHKSPHLVGPGGTIELPDIEGVVAFHAEAELAFVIGRAARKVSARDAMAHVAGYLPFFDVSARGLARKSQFLPKGQETFAAAGPWITTADEIGDPHALTVRSWVNGRPSQDYGTGLLAHKIADQIAWLSRFVTLRTGDVVATGACTTGLMPFNVGDHIEIEISRLGRARFEVGGDSPPKTADFRPGDGPGPRITRV